LSDADKRIIRVLQQHLPVESRPFDRWAKEIGMTVQQLLAGARRYISLGVMRRFSAVLRHREVGVSANAMGVWVVPLEKQDAFGEFAAQNPAVSHCYARPTYPDWPYSLFTMVHGTSRQQCESVLAALSAATGIQDYSWLYSTVEYKKVRVKYFVGDIEEWESKHAEALR
jgi:DNA-binding Lrp family transcriptional regulator